jgi:hypothetical protein
MLLEVAFRVVFELPSEVERDPIPGVCRSFFLVRLEHVVGHESSDSGEVNSGHLTKYRHHILLLIGGVRPDAAGTVFLPSPKINAEARFVNVIVSSKGHHNFHLRTLRNQLAPNLHAGCGATPMVRNR